MRDNNIYKEVICECHACVHNDGRLLCTASHIIIKKNGKCKMYKEKKDENKSKIFRRY